MTNADYWERKCLNRCGNPDSLYPAGYEDNRKPPEHDKGPFCDDGCKECLQVDREHGLIYTSWLVRVEDVPEGVQTWSYNKEGYVLVGWEDGSQINGTCAYCGAELKGG